MDAARITRDALEDGYECIVAVGGDGTLNEVINGFFRETARPSTRTRPWASCRAARAATSGAPSGGTWS